MTGKLEEKIKEAKANGKERKFLESLELAINLKDLDLSNPKNRINDEVVLPKGRGREYKVAIFASEEMRQKVKATIDISYGPEDLSKFADNKKDFKKIVNQVEYFIAESNLMATIGKSLGQVLGPRGKIPRPVPPGQDPSSMIGVLKRTVRVRTRDKKTFHVPVGTRAMPEEDVGANIREVFKRIIGKLEKGSSNIDSIYIKTTMGKAVKLDLGDLN
ncbi:MAG: 50S ribosomal protein L1 [Candidatus Thermoplasmatota archaeon]|jgi:large subunit ribosomal protein L1|nr:50S ribosomal protein L1 [Candidatus Thermoplasmatota archaeon]MCL5787695.1 50S ribosomal protein L1 [Candidatus Thermoplasmatota archaeon]